MTLANLQRILRDRPYAKNFAERLLKRLIAIEDIRGTGRLYVPLEARPGSGGTATGRPTGRVRPADGSRFTPSRSTRIGGRSGPP
jgi:hypothetical protein